MNDSILKTIGVAFSVCLVCSLIVSSAAVSLRDLQNENKSKIYKDKFINITNAYKTILESFTKPEKT